jgi:hypothetical protein
LDTPLDEEGWNDYIRNLRETNFCVLLELKQEYERLTTLKKVTRSQQAFMVAYEKNCLKEG